jgi:hypothetical protein
MHPSPSPPQRRRGLDDLPAPRETLALVFSPLAWLKLQFFLHAGETEVGGFGISAERDPLYVEEFVTVRQATTPVSVEFADDAVADHFDACVDAGLPPARFARVWCHTHPGDSPTPSHTDERTFARVFGRCDWSVMFVLSRTGRTYARLAFAAGPGGSLLLPVEVDWANWPYLVLEGHVTLGELMAGWAAEFERNVRPVPLRRPRRVPVRDGRDADGPGDYPRLAREDDDGWGEWDLDATEGAWSALHEAEAEGTAVIRLFEEHPETFGAEREEVPS